jgi:hemerythrin-like metal-binding protein
MTDQGWKDAVHTGHARMDAEHQVELALLDALHEAVSRDLGPNRVAEVLEQLLEHTNVHFMSEQLLMRLTAYPQYEAHAEEHDELIVKARMLQSHVAAGEIKPTLALIDSMRNWLVQHMDGKDRALAAYLSGHSGKSVPIA